MVGYIDTKLQKSWCPERAFCDSSSSSVSTRSQASDKSADTCKVTKNKRQRKNIRHHRAVLRDHGPRFSLTLRQSGVSGSACNITVTIKEGSKTITDTPTVVPEAAEVAVIPCTEDSPRPVSRGDERQRSKSTGTEVAGTTSVSRKIAVSD